MFTQFGKKDSNHGSHIEDDQHLPEKLIVVRNLLTEDVLGRDDFKKDDLGRFMAAYLILQDVKTPHEDDGIPDDDEKAVRGWIGTIVSRLYKHINDNKEVANFLEGFREELGTHFSGRKSKL